MPPTHNKKIKLPTPITIKERIFHPPRAQVHPEQGKKKKKKQTINLQPTSTSQNKNSTDSPNLLFPKSNQNQHLTPEIKQPKQEPPLTRLPREEAKETLGSREKNRNLPQAMPPKYERKRGSRRGGGYIAATGGGAGPSAGLLLRRRQPAAIGELRFLAGLLKRNEGAGWGGGGQFGPLDPDLGSTGGMRLMHFYCVRTRAARAERGTCGTIRGRSKGILVFS